MPLPSTAEGQPFKPEDAWLYPMPGAAPPESDLTYALREVRTALLHLWYVIEWPVWQRTRRIRELWRH